MSREIKEFKGRVEEIREIEFEGKKYALKLVNKDEETFWGVTGNVPSYIKEGKITTAGYELDSLGVPLVVSYTLH